MKTRKRIENLRRRRGAGLLFAFAKFGSVEFSYVGNCGRVIDTSEISESRRPSPSEGLRSEEEDIVVGVSGLRDIWKQPKVALHKMIVKRKQSTLGRFDRTYHDKK